MTIARLQRRRHVDFLSDHGEVETFVTSENVRVILEIGHKVGVFTRARSTLSLNRTLQVMVKKKGRWQKAEVARKETQNVYTVRYEDGSRDHGVKRENMRMYESVMSESELQAEHQAWLLAKQQQQSPR